MNTPPVTIFGCYALLISFPPPLSTGQKLCSVGPRNGFRVCRCYPLRFSSFSFLCCFPGEFRVFFPAPHSWLSPSQFHDWSPRSLIRPFVNEEVFLTTSLLSFGHQFRFLCSCMVLRKLESRVASRCCLFPFFYGVKFPPRGTEVFVPAPSLPKSIRRRF